MKKYIYCLSFLFIINNISAQGISFFQGTWQEAIETAIKQDKLIFVDAYTKWCGPCKSMAKNIFTQKKAGDFYNANFINVKMDMEGEDNYEFISKYPVKAYPTLLFIDGEGIITHKSVGGKSIEDFIKLGETAILANNKSADYEIIYNEGERSFSFILKYIKELNAGNKSSLKVANDYIKSKPNISSEEMITLIYESMSEIDSKFYDKFVNEKSNIIALHSQEGYTNKIESACKRTLGKAIEYESIELVKVAVKACKSENKANYKVFKLEAFKTYYLAMNDKDAYIKVVKSYYKKIAKNDAEKIFTLVKEMITSYIEDEEIQNLADKYFDQVITLEPSIKNLLYASQYYGKIKVMDKAIEYAELALHKVKNKKKNTKNIEDLIRRYKKS